MINFEECRPEKLRVSMAMTFISGQRCPRAQHLHILQVQSASVNQGDGTGLSGANATVNCIPGGGAYVRCFTERSACIRSHPISDADLISKITGPCGYNDIGCSDTENILLLRLTFFV